MISGCDLDAALRDGRDLDAVLERVLAASATTGLQATELHRARVVVDRAVREKRAGGAGRIFLSYTSNMISSGLRELFAFLARHRLVDAFVTTAGGVEEDCIKCLGRTLVADFALKGAELRAKGLNRVGNLLIPNNNYVEFEAWFDPLLAKIHARQRESRWRELTAPSEIVREMGLALGGVAGREDSVVYWCAVHGIPIFCPALTDGSMGDMIFFYNFNHPGMIVDPLRDLAELRRLMPLAGDDAPATFVVLGGGLPKHTLLRGNNVVCANRVVVVSTGSEADGCVSSTCVDDDVSQGLLCSADQEVVVVRADATLVAPLLFRPLV